jgi:hypothetical protein
MALVTLLVVFIFGFFLAGFGNGSGGVRDIGTGKTLAPHHVKCSARMGSGENRRDCGGPPANP